MSRWYLASGLMTMLLVGWVQAGILPLGIKHQIQDSYGDEGVKRVEQWEQLVWDLRFQDPLVKVAAVNLFFNKLEFVTDADHWQQQDYWATPIETLATNGGDCEDFAIAKYFTLRQLGVAAEQLRITYVRAKTLAEPHMVLTYYPADGEALVLDILTQQLTPASKRLDLIPVYSFNGDGLWKAENNGRETRLGSSESIALWQEMQLRLGLGKL